MPATPPYYNGGKHAVGGISRWSAGHEFGWTSVGGCGCKGWDGGLGSHDINGVVSSRSHGGLGLLSPQQS